MFQIMIYIVHIVQTDLSSCITIHTCHCARVCVSWQAHGPGPDNDSKVHFGLYCCIVLFCIAVLYCWTWQSWLKSARCAVSRRVWQLAWKRARKRCNTESICQRLKKSHFWIIRILLECLESHMMGSIETLKKEKEETIMTKRKAKDSKKENS